MRQSSFCLPKADCMEDHVTSPGQLASSRCLSENVFFSKPIYCEFPMQDKITPCFWFDGNAEEAVSFYTSIFTESRVVATSRYGEGAPLPAGTVMTISFELQGRSFLAINGGPQFQFSPAISMMVSCETQQEIDHLWKELSQGGQPLQCGWLTDRFGVSWQIVPAILSELMTGDAEKSSRVMQALWGMEKLIIEELQQAAESRN